MSKFLNTPHSSMVLLATVALADLSVFQEKKVSINPNVVFDRIVMRANFNFESGQNKAEKPKFGGLYNIIRKAQILINSDEKHNVLNNLDLYSDTFIRDGREDNAVDYFDLPPTFTQNIDYCFAGRKTVLGGITVPDAAFALDLRHTAAGVNTFNSVELCLDVGTIADVFETPNDSKITSMSIEIWAEQIYNDAQAEAYFSVNGQRYAEMITSREERKVTDTALQNVFNLEAYGGTSAGVYLSDVTIIQLDEKGQPVPFTDDNQIVQIVVGDFVHSEYPIWKIREAQNGRRVEGTPPNLLHVPVNSVNSPLGGLSPALLLEGASIRLKANEVENQTGQTMLHVSKKYSYKPQKAG